MNTLTQLFIATFLATSAMSFFSSVLSGFNVLYTEPVLLKYILRKMLQKKIHVKISDTFREFIAWMLHYSIGLIFVLTYYMLWHYKVVLLNVSNGLWLGSVSGFISIISWFIIFKLFGSKRKVYNIGYYVQLYLGHIIFGLVASVAYLIFINCD